MVKSAVERHEGTIEVQSEVGEGTTFRISLPAGGGDSGSPEPQELRKPQHDNLGMLVIEDTAAQRELYTEYFRMLGHKVESAKDGPEGLEKFEQGDFDVVITDRSMPEMSGDEVARAVKESSNEVPVIMLTGFGEMMDAAGENPGEVDLLLSKPASLSDLLRALGRGLSE